MPMKLAHFLYIFLILTALLCRDQEFYHFSCMIYYCVPMRMASQPSKIYRTQKPQKGVICSECDNCLLSSHVFTIIEIHLPGWFCFLFRISCIIFKLPSAIKNVLLLINGLFWPITPPLQKTKNNRSMSLDYIWKPSGLNGADKL